MAKVTAPNGEKMPDTDNAGLLAFYERRGYTVTAKRARGKHASDTPPPSEGDKDPSAGDSTPDEKPADGQ